MHLGESLQDIWHLERAGPVRVITLLDHVLGARRFLANSKLVHVLDLANHVGSLKRRVAVAVLRGGGCPSSLRLVALYLGYDGYPKAHSRVACFDS